MKHPEVFILIFLKPTVFLHLTPICNQVVEDITGRQSGQLLFQQALERLPCNFDALCLNYFQVLTEAFNDCPIVKSVQRPEPLIGFVVVIIFKLDDHDVLFYVFTQLSKDQEGLARL